MITKVHFKKKAHQAHAGPGPTMFRRRCTRRFTDSPQVWLTLLPSGYQALLPVAWPFSSHQGWLQTFPGPFPCGSLQPRNAKHLSRHSCCCAYTTRSKGRRMRAPEQLLWPRVGGGQNSPHDAAQAKPTEPHETAAANRCSSTHVARATIVSKPTMQT